MSYHTAMGDDKHMFIRVLLNTATHSIHSTKKITDPLSAGKGKIFRPDTPSTDLFGPLLRNLAKGLPLPVAEINLPQILVDLDRCSQTEKPQALNTPFHRAA